MNIKNIQIGLVISNFYLVYVNYSCTFITSIYFQTQNGTYTYCCLKIAIVPSFFFCFIRFYISTYTYMIMSQSTGQNFVLLLPPLFFCYQIIPSKCYIRKKNYPIFSFSWLYVWSSAMPWIHHITQSFYCILCVALYILDENIYNDIWSEMKFLFW